MQLFHLLHSGHTAGSPAGTDRFQHGALLGLDLVLIDLEVSREQVTDGSSRAEKVFVSPLSLDMIDPRCATTAIQQMLSLLDPGPVRPFTLLGQLDAVADVVMARLDEPASDQVAPHERVVLAEGRALNSRTLASDLQASAPLRLGKRLQGVGRRPSSDPGADRVCSAPALVRERQDVGATGHAEFGSDLPQIRVRRQIEEHRFTIHALVQFRRRAGILAH